MWSVAVISQTQGGVQPVSGTWGHGEGVRGVVLVEFEFDRHTGTQPSHSIHQLFVFGWLPSQGKFGYSDTRSVDQDGLILGYLPASASGVLRLKVRTTAPGPKLSFNDFSQVGSKRRWVGFCPEVTSPFIQPYFVLFFNLFIFLKTGFSPIPLPGAPFSFDCTI